MCPTSLLLQSMSDDHYLVASGSGHTVPSQATQGTTEKSCCVDPMQKHCNGPIPLTRTLGTQHSLTEMVGKHSLFKQATIPKRKWTDSISWAFNQHGLGGWEHHRLPSPVSSIKVLLDSPCVVAT